MRNLYIITGASRGLGLAIVERLLAPGAALLTMSRRSNSGLTARANATGATLEQWQVDLNDGTAAAARLESWLGKQHAGFTSATLVNNAALAGKPGLVATISAESLAAVVRVGLEAPLLLTSAFLRATREWKIPRKILNISSGAGKLGLPGAAAYCAVKAGLDHLSRTVAMEEEQVEKGAKIVSLAPGVIDTDMQTELRDADPNAFPPQPHFADMRTSGQLATPAAAAERVISFLNRSDFGSKPVADVRDP